MRLTATFLFALVMLAVVHGQQSPSSAEPVFRSASSDLVVLPVTAVDRHGRSIVDIPPERFTVFDNGRPQKIALFSNEDTPITIGLVIDNSGSMGRKLGEVIAASIAFARLSNPQDELFVLQFNETVQDALSVVPFQMAGDLAELQAGLESLKPQGRTALYDALVAALDRLERGTRPRKALLLISDGGDNVSRATLDEVLARAKRSSATVYTIGLFDDGDPDRNPGVLKTLAHETGGERFLPASAGPLLQACQRIAREIRSGYTIGYEPPDRDGAYHRVRVEIAAPSARDTKLRTRPGYVAPAKVVD